MASIDSDRDLGELLSRIRSVAVVGASPDPGRPSNSVSRYLAGATGWTVWFVNPNVGELFGQPVYPSLDDLPGVPDLVDVFRRRDQLEDVTRQAIDRGASALWFQLGLVDEHAAAIAVEAGLDVVQDRCLAVEHRRLIRTG